MTDRAYAYGIPRGEPFATERFPPWTVWRADRRPCRVHITAPADWQPGSSLAGKLAFCGVGAYSTAKGPKVTVDPHAPLAPGESWCPRCLGGAVFHLGGEPTLEALLRTLLAERAT